MSPFFKIKSSQFFKKDFHKVDIHNVVVTAFDLLSEMQTAAVIQSFLFASLKPVSSLNHLSNDLKHRWPITEKSTIHYV